MAGTSRNVPNLDLSNSEEEDHSDIGEALSDTEYESETDEDTEYNPTWCSTTQGLRHIEFTKENKLLGPAPGNNEPIDWFLFLFDIIQQEEIVKQTNKYGEEVYFSPSLTPGSRINKWKELSVEELKIFVGLIFYMGTVKVNRMQDYWKTDEMFDFKFVRDKMARDRFLLILRCLHFASNQANQDDRLHKVRYLIDSFNNKMDSMYYPCKELSLDEGMMLWRGRLNFRQYIKGKRHKYGLKFYMLCEPTGLVLRFTIYSGKEGNLSGKGHATKVVLHLMRGKLYAGHSLYMDSYYNSFVLASKLLSRDTYCTGTVRQDRKFLPQEVKSAKLKKGQTIERYAQGIMVAKWKDKRVVTYMSTEFENTMAISNNRHGQPRSKPLPIIHYNAEMKGVDRSDQMASYYPCNHKSLRWYKKVFVHVIQMYMINAFRLYRFANTNSSMTLYDFRLQVIKALLPPKDQQITPPRRPLEVGHVVSLRPSNVDGRRVFGKRCRVCYQEGTTKRTHYYCAQCPSEPALCPVACFAKFHAQ